MADVKTLLEYIKSKETYTEYAFYNNDIFNNNLTHYLQRRIQTDLSGASVSEALSRLNTTNILPKLVNKLSQVYNSTNIHSTLEVDVPQLSKVNVQKTLTLANKMLNLHNCVALEPFLTNRNEIFVRVLPAHEFLVYSDDPQNPNRVTHFIKVLSQTKKGSRYAIYTDTQYYELDHKGNISGVMDHEYGRIPFTYITKATTNLMPTPNVDVYEMTTLLPLMLTDANYALKFQAFSIIYALDADATEMKLAPNSVWFIKSEGETRPEIGSIKPSLSIDESIKNIEMQYSLWLDTKNLKTSALRGSNASQRQMSGIAKMIDDADIAADISEQRDIMESAHNDLFALLQAKFNLIELEDVKVSYSPISRIPETNTEKLDRVIKQLQAGLITRIDSIKILHGFDTDEEAMDYLSRIDNGNV